MTLDVLVSIVSFVSSCHQFCLPPILHPEQEFICECFSVVSQTRSCVHIISRDKQNQAGWRHVTSCTTQNQKKFFFDFYFSCRQAEPKIFPSQEHHSSMSDTPTWARDYFGKLLSGITIQRCIHQCHLKLYCAIRNLMLTMMVTQMRNERHLLQFVCGTGAVHTTQSSGCVTAHTATCHTIHEMTAAVSTAKLS